MNNKIKLFETESQFNDFVNALGPTNGRPNVSYITNTDNVEYLQYVNCIVAGDSLDNCKCGLYNGTIDVGGETYHEWSIYDYVFSTHSGSSFVTETRNPSVGDYVGRLQLNRYGAQVVLYTDETNFILSVHNYATSRADVVYNASDGKYKKVNAEDWDSSLGTPIGVEVISGDKTLDGKTVIIDLHDLNGGATYVWGGYTKDGFNHIYQDITELSPVACGYGHLDMDGLYNTDKIIAYLGDTLYDGNTYAAKAARATSADGKVEWYLPSVGEAIKGQMMAIRINLALDDIGGDVFYWTNDYWTSSIKSNINAWTIDDYGIVKGGDYKSSRLPIRRFGRVRLCK